MDPSQSLEQDHAKAHTLQRVQHTKPKPERAPDKSRSDRSSSPRHVLPNVARAPQHLTPPRRTEADGKDGENPGVILGEDSEDPEEGGPDEDEEQDAKQHDLPRLRVVRRPKIRPVAPVRRRQEVVLDDDSNKKPQDDLSSEQARVEARHRSWCLSIVVWQSEEHDDSSCPHDDRNGNRDVCDCNAVGKVSTGRDITLG